jgi:hypothetical protein
MLHHDNAPAHTSLFIREFLAKHETTVIPQPPYSWLLRTFFVPRVEIHPEGSPISDDTRARREFATGPKRYAAKRVLGRIPELEKTLEAVYRQWRGVL